MLISSVNLLPDEIGIFLRLAVLCALSAVVAVVVHGWFQALVATAFGDPAPRAQGRLLGNPLRHVDPAGAILAAVSGFGWGRPMTGRPDRHGRWPSVAIAAAGPVGNLTVAFLLAAPIKAGLLSWAAPSPDSLTLVMTGGLRSGISRYCRWLHWPATGRWWPCCRSQPTKPTRNFSVSRPCCWWF